MIYYSEKFNAQIKFVFVECPEGNINYYYRNNIFDANAANCFRLRNKFIGLLLYTLRCVFKLYCQYYCSKIPEMELALIEI